MADWSKLVGLLDKFLKIDYFSYDLEYECPGHESNTSGTVIVAGQGTVSLQMNQVELEPGLAKVGRP